MGYTITVYTDTFYDGTDVHPASNIRLVTGNNQVGKLTFTVPYSPENDDLPSLLRRKNYGQVVMRHSHGTRSALLFVGLITATQTDIEGNMTVTCEDELSLLDRFLFRLQDGGYELSSSNIAKVMPYAMRIFNGFHDVSFQIDRCIVLSSSSSGGTLTGYVLPNGTVSSGSNLFPSSYHQFEPDKVRSFLDLLRSLADSIDATIYIKYSDDLSTRSIVLDARTSYSRAHTYSYGKDLMDASVWYDSSKYYNAAYALGGTRREGGAAGLSSITAIVTKAAGIGSTSLSLRLSSGTRTINSNYYICVTEAGVSDPSGPTAVWHDIDVDGDVTLSTSATTVNLGWAYLQRSVAQGEEVYIYSKETLEQSSYGLKEYLTEVHAYSIGEIPSGYALSDSGSVIYHVGGVGRCGPHIFVYNDSNVISSKLLMERAATEIKKRIKQSRNLDVRFIGIEVTHDYDSYDASSHTMVGDVVHITHDKLEIDDDFRVNGMEVNVDDPTQNKYMLGLSRPTATRTIGDVDKSINDRIYDSRRQR